MTRRRMLTTAAVTALVAAVPMAAFGVWSVTGSASGDAATGGITAPTSVSVPSSVTNGSVAVSWAGATAPNGSSLKYFVERRAEAGSTWTAACGTLSAPIGQSSCTQTAVADGAYRYRVTSRLGSSWRATSAESAKVTVSTPVTPVAATVVAAPAPDTTADAGSTSVTGISVSQGSTLAVLVYRHVSGNSAPALSSISGTAIQGTPTLLSAGSNNALQTFGSPERHGIWAYQATASGTSNSSLTVNFSGANNIHTKVVVLRISGHDPSSLVAAVQLASSGNKSTTATGTLAGASANNGHILFIGSEESTTMSQPAGFTSLDAPPAAGARSGTFFKDAAQSSQASSALGGNVRWASISLEIKRAP